MHPGHLGVGEVGNLQSSPLTERTRKTELYGVPPVGQNRGVCVCGGGQVAVGPLVQGDASIRHSVCDHFSGPCLQLIEAWVREGADGGDAGRAQWKLMWQRLLGQSPSFQGAHAGNGRRLGFSAQRLPCCVTLSKLFSFSGPLASIQ